jgi:glycine/D-amino acid oxidase-like deaminating enzyme
MSVAILGAGIQGSLAALALAQKGRRVCLFDKQSRAMSRASRWNEGKLHLGFIFANDASMKSAELMIDGALCFQSIVERLCEVKFDEEMVSETFNYARHTESLLTAEQLEEHYAKVDTIIQDRSGACSDSYLGYGGGPSFTRMSTKDLETYYNPAMVTDVWSTVERSIDSQLLADTIEAAIESEPLIEFYPEHRITGIEVEPDGQFSVCFDAETKPYRFKQVVNALWESRLEMDTCLGISPDRGFLHRYKFAIHAEGVSGAPVPSTSFVLGPFGDIVRFDDSHYYFSWYPIGCQRFSNSLIPPAWDETVIEKDKQKILADSIPKLAELVPGVAGLDLRKIPPVVEGGFIFTWGKNGIRDLNSEIHSRFRIGVSSKGNYHSIDTGKYTTAPLFAEQIAEAICGDSGK